MLADYFVPSEQTTEEKATTFEAVVVSEPTEKPKTMAMDLRTTADGRLLKCWLRKNEQSRQVMLGDRLRISARVTPLREWKSGTFDYRRYLEIHGFSGQTFVRNRDWTQMPRSWQGLTAGQRLKLWFLCRRHKLLERYQQWQGEDREYAVLAAMTLGDKSAMTKELREIYSVSGASHVLALSGLHLGIIYMLLSLLTVNRRWRVVTLPLVVLSIWAFALLVGLPASVVRASIMISLYALLTLIGRRRSAIGALTLSAFLILVVSPLTLYDLGFQLSFLAMLSILLTAPLFDRLLPRAFLMNKRALRWLWGLLTVSLSAQIGVAPLIAYHFGRFPTYFLLTNLVVIPATLLILYLTLAALIIPALSVLLLRVVELMNQSLTWIATALPCPSIEGLHPTLTQTFMLYVLMASTYQLIKMKQFHEPI